LWHYAANETLATIATAGYFNGVKTLMNIGDIVIVNGSDDTAIKVVGVTGENITLGALA
jgi:hypothetical protein